VHISCERCATVYVLDDKLIPAGGAPVQCTRCGLVFTARPARSSPPAARPPAPAGVRRAPGADPAPVKRAKPGLGRQPTPPQNTQIFGSAPSLVAAANRDAGDATLVASPGRAPGGEGEEGANGTIIFGSSARPSLEETPRPSSRAAASGSPAAAQAEDAGDSGRTRVFGSPARPLQEEPGQSGRTMVFGSAARPAGEGARSPAKTAVFGAMPAPVQEERGEAAGAGEQGLEEAQAASSGRTMVFGVLAPALGGEAAEPKDEPGSADQTLVFGRARSAPSEAPRAKATQMFGAAAEPAEATDIANSGASAVEIPAVPLPGEGAAPKAADGAAPAEEPAPAASKALQGPALGAELEGDEAPSAEAGSAQVHGAADSSGEPIGGPSPEAVWPKRAQPTAPPQPGAARAGAQTVQLQLALKKSRRRLPMILGGAALGLGLALGVAAFFVLRTPKVEPAILDADLSALNLMKKDDSASLKQAIAAWQELQHKAPSYLPAQANQIMANTLLAQDLGDEIRRLKARAEVARAEMKRLEEKKEAADAAQRAGEKREELVKLNAQMEPLIDEARKADDAAGELIKRCKEAAVQSPDSAAVFRATAVYFGVKGNDNAERLAQVYRRGKDERGVLHDDARAFADLAEAALYAQPRSAPDRREKGVAAARAALEKDPALMRARVLQVKLLLAARDFGGARKVVGEIVAANPAHLAAARLIQDIDAAAHLDQAP
jgi:predicted Zn finger-like uncharacterized protein